MRKSLIATFLATFIAAASTVPAIAGPGKGDPMIPLKASPSEVFNNEFQVDLQDLKGYVVVVEFWATWCGPCKKSIPHLNELHAKYKDQGVVIVGLSDEPAGTVKGFLGKMAMDYIVVANSQSIRDYGVNGIPHAFVVDPTGKITWAGNPLNPDFDQALADAVRSTPPARRLGGGPEFNAFLLDRMEQALRRNEFAAVVDDLNRLDTKSLAEEAAHVERYDALKAKLEQAAKAAYDNAEAQYAAKEYAAAVNGFEEIATSFQGLEIAQKASERAKALNREPAVQNALRSSTLEKFAANALLRAERFADMGQDVLAYKKYQSILEKYDGTDSAKAARERIDAYEADAEFMKKLNESEG